MKKSSKYMDFIDYVDNISEIYKLLIMASFFCYLVFRGLDLLHENYDPIWGETPKMPESVCSSYFSICRFISR